MTPTTRRIREMSFRVVECDVPEELTLEEYRLGAQAPPAENSAPKLYSFSSRIAPASSAGN